MNYIANCDSKTTKFPEKNTDYHDIKISKDL